MHFSGSIPTLKEPKNEKNMSLFNGPRFLLWTSILLNTVPECQHIVLNCSQTYPVVKGVITTFFSASFYNVQTAIVEFF